MTIKEFKNNFIYQLSPVYPQTEIDTFFFYLIEEYLNLQRIDITLQPNFEISSENETLLNKALARLKKEEPIQYILGKTEFYGLPFHVNRHTLIPRPETEELVEWIISEVKEIRTNNQTKSLSILDIGTGSGCIPISLKVNIDNSTICAIDVSEEALKIAKHNSDLNNSLVQFLNLDILKADSLNVFTKKTTSDEIIKFNIIVSNPPYVRNLEKIEIKNNVLQNEPHLALFVEDDNPLIFYTKIADLAKKHLSSDGFLFFEINQYLGSQTVGMLHQKGFKNIELRKDLFGNNRMIKANL
ncbi:MULTISPECIES: peptide chain release factor N(5)-glutamine methyltransferase [Tenacibaculum]|uniref:peptide chain release factor N(5)-glutamine methyltransferase n=1 Tax=Tenacibaculum TaxID=104267 RepID=UPI00089783F9|nr:peptide chain release factor N(5)-glutamine methyltransferase [Tenacibaculum sp. MAR_2010_89]SEE47841.1 release factor glutamine methyltransferase [Tenacibaculum sp. MAR_2010_89]